MIFMLPFGSILLKLKTFGRVTASPNVSFDSIIQPIAKSICENSNVICFNSTVSVQASSVRNPVPTSPDYYRRQYSMCSSVALMHALSSRNLSTF